MSKAREIVNMQLSLARRVPEAAREYAGVKIGCLGKYAPGEVPFAMVRLSYDGPRRLVAHGTLHVDGHAVNADAGAETFIEVVDLLQDRLKAQLVKMHG
ncbi:hypothetical protein KCV87_10585 [Actinosynnema pretiosum subsp. pretiosum]|uniref:Uncharacterized protein n=2 Tax=Actinosynnema TaxID=40566 RepID=C6WEC1_ACTMD|nr:HPF/RaiA family ribosome-associated protein [Actinosynnema mirum]ACU35864.1 hypothetical protein Amir_1916 [Actinosynnema mirum DSM 43827]AXX29288.1 hypothetical protein APASM_1923 [Actinosynnema pretiosum subsp. pretiosum]QUF06455.1 hypothetical protein KCV87_10585 [Actinosynnema pretiosum subsp. pretiosum]